MLKNNLKTQIFLLFLFSRIIILFTPTLGNHPEFVNVVLQILGGQNPYASPDAANINFPPFHYLIYAFFILIFGPINFAFKVCTFVFDIGTVFVLYKIAEQLEQYQGRAWVPVLFFAFFPTILYEVFNSMETINSEFFFALAIYFFLKKRFFWMGIFAGIGTLTEIYPIFFLYLVCIIFLARRQFFNLFYSIVGFLCAYLCITIPFFGLNVLTIVIVQLSRQTTIVSLLAWLPDWTLAISSNLTFNVYALIIVGCILFLGACVYYYARHNELSEKQQVKIFAWFYLFLPVLFLNMVNRYFMWILPFIIIIVDLPKDEKFWRNALIYVDIALIPAVVAIFLIYPHVMFENVQDFICGNLNYPPCAFNLTYVFWKTKYIASDPQLNLSLGLTLGLLLVLSFIWLHFFGRKSRIILNNTQTGVYNYLFKMFLFAGIISNAEVLIVYTPNMGTFLVLFLLFSGTGITIVLIIYGIIIFYLNCMRTSSGIEKLLGTG